MRTEGFCFIVGVWGLDCVRLACCLSSSRVVVGCGGVFNLSPLGEAFGEICRWQVIVRFVAQTVVLRRWMGEDEFTAQVQRLVRSAVFCVVTLVEGGVLGVLDVAVPLGFAFQAVASKLCFRDKSQLE